MKAKAEKMIQTIKSRYGLDDPSVFSAMLQVPREIFVYPKYESIAYEDRPIDIGFGQTISQPYTVAYMTSLLALSGSEKVLEVGTGSGYQTAILSKLANKVYSIEIIPELAILARKRLNDLRVKNVKIKVSSGEYGWEKYAPFDRIIVAAAIDEKVPEALISQISDSGILVLPLVKKGQTKMIKITKKGKDVEVKKLGEFSFVPFVRSKE